VGQWTYIAATYDQVTARLYVNGAEVASQSASVPIPSSTRELWIGNDEGNASFNRQFDGLVDEVMLHSRALAAAEIAAVYAAGGRAPCSGAASR